MARLEVAGGGLEAARGSRPWGRKGVAAPERERGGIGVSMSTGEGSSLE